MFDEILKLFGPLGQIIPTGERIKEVFRDISDGVEALNYRFVGSRQRVTEFSAAIGDAVPLVEKLGGNAADVSKTIDSVAAATKRNVVASSDEVTRLFAAQKLTGVDAQTLVDKFQNVGVGFSQIGTQLEGSIKYIQSVGGNARDIMQQVNGIVENINKYNFQDGVLGLTRMSTQAQLLKFDMNQTLILAEKALNPEGAIELASAFQRLGVSAGDLTDPFQLMYKALNDPEGLQNSLISVTKQFTYFDEQAKSFKINPQGMLMLREIGAQAGLSSAELSKMALNAADLDAKLSQISPSFQFENEEDKQYIANIAKMGKGGEYEITVKDAGIDKTIPLQQATNEQLQELIERQKIGQEDKTLEQIQKDQLDLLSLLTGELKSTRDTYVAGIASSTKLTEAISGMSTRLAAIEGIQDFIKEQGLSTTTKSVRGETDETLGKASKVIKDFINNEGEIIMNTITPTLDKINNSFKNAASEISKKISEAIDKIEARGINVPDVIQRQFTPSPEQGSGAFVQPRLTNISSNSIIADRLEFKNTNDFMASAINNRTVTEQISNLTTSTAKVETKTTKFEFGEIPPLKIVFDKAPGFTDGDTAILEYNLNKGNITEMLTKGISEKLKLIQSKDV